MSYAFAHEGRTMATDGHFGPLEAHHHELQQLLANQTELLDRREALQAELAQQWSNETSLKLQSVERRIRINKKILFTLGHLKNDPDEHV